MVYPTMLLTVLLLLAALPVLFVTGYLLLLTLLSGAPRRPPPVQPTLRFTVVVPAHDEAAGIGRTVASLLALRWPAELRRVLVVADNCSDDTAGQARAAGAEVLERRDSARRGKGYALEYAFESVLREAWADAVVVIDADTTVSADLLGAFGARLAGGAQAVQAFYGVLNPDAGWRTRLITIALAIFHRLRGRGREALGVSCGLRGNGMCFTAGALRAVPHRAFSIVEDLEYGIQLGRAGIRVHYADEAEVLGEMVSSEQSARSQRQRWEGGRGQMARAHGWPLLRDALRQRSALLFDLAMDVLVPPLSSVGLAAIVLAIAGIVLRGLGAVGSPAAAIALIPALILIVHVARGVALSRLGWRGWAALASAPGYVLWKLLLKFRHRPDAQAWVRTDREATGDKPPVDR